MTNVSEQELEVVKANPSGAGLDAFRDLVNSKYLCLGLNHEDMKQVVLQRNQSVEYTSDRWQEVKNKATSRPVGLAYSEPYTEGAYVSFDPKALTKRIAG